MLTEIIFQILKWIAEKAWNQSQKLNSNKAIESLKDDIEIYKAMEELCRSISSERCLFVNLHNCGGRIIPGKNKFITITDEYRYNDKIPTRQLRYQKILADETIMKKVLNMCFSESKLHALKTQDLPNGKLHNMYVTDGVKNAVVAFCASNENHIWYLSIHFFEKNEIEINDAFIDAVNTCRTKITNIISKYYQLEERY